MRDVKGYEGLYGITSCGKVWSYRSKRFLNPTPDKDGYLQLTLSKDGSKKKAKVHRLVAETYIDNPNNYETVDHIDGNKAHNYIKNLRWMSNKDNAFLGNAHKCKPIICLETNKVFVSGWTAARAMNLNQTSISRVCNGKQKTTGGYHFKFLKKEMI